MTTDTWIGLGGLLFGGLQVALTVMQIRLGATEPPAANPQPEEAAIGAVPILPGATGRSVSQVHVRLIVGFSMVGGAIDLAFNGGQQATVVGVWILVISLVVPTIPWLWIKKRRGQLAIPLIGVAFGVIAQGAWGNWLFVGGVLAGFLAAAAFPLGSYAHQAAAAYAVCAAIGFAITKRYGQEAVFVTPAIGLRTIFR